MKIHLCAGHLKQVADASGPGEVEKTAVWTDVAAPCSICGSTPTTALGCVLVAADGTEVIDEVVPTLALTASRFAALASEAAKEKAS